MLDEGEVLEVAQRVPEQAVELEPEGVGGQLGLDALHVELLGHLAVARRDDLPEVGDRPRRSRLTSARQSCAWASAGSSATRVKVSTSRSLNAAR